MEVCVSSADDGGAMMGKRALAEGEELGVGEGGAVLDEGAGAIELPSAEGPFLFIELAVGGGGDCDGDEGALTAPIARDAAALAVDASSLVLRTGDEGADVIGLEGDGFLAPGPGAVV